MENGVQACAILLKIQCMMMENGGDATAGDSIYTVQYKYQKNSTDVGMEFKFGINGEDNESGLA